VRAEQDTELTRDFAPRPRGCQLAPRLRGPCGVLPEMLLVAGEPCVLTHGPLISTLRALEQCLDAFLLVTRAVTEFPFRFVDGGRKPREGRAEDLLGRRPTGLLLDDLPFERGDLRPVS